MSFLSLIQNDQKVSGATDDTVRSSDAQRIFDHPVYYKMKFVECGIEEIRDEAEAVTTAGCERLNLQTYYIEVTNRPGVLIQVSQ